MHERAEAGRERAQPASPRTGAPAGDEDVRLAQHRRGAWVRERATGRIDAYVGAPVEPIPAPSAEQTVAQTVLDSDHDGPASESIHPCDARAGEKGRQEVGRKEELAEDFSASFVDGGFM
ncbi:hypothetical protein GCM10009801_14000 [Streptomyces albiaxialis]|uniref:Uncharacterized protein n=1 Tax=Streptomyces albiaxialis TaxID=329523 RepID=A0ABN2VNV9_9ACTN